MTTPSQPAPHGTAQHPDARDLSQYLIHMTRTESDLVSIVMNGVIEARSTHGVGRGYEAQFGGQASVCLTEMPIAELGRMLPRGRQFGIVFSKEALRERRRAQPVWYVSDPSDQLDNVRQLMSASRAASDPVWKLTPFIDIARSGSAATGPHDWRWEREWRVVGHLEFEIEDVAAILIPTPTGGFEPISDVTFGAPYMTHDGDFYWVDGFMGASDAAMKILYDKFVEDWMTPDEALLPYDPESEWGYAEVVPVHETDDAVAWSFDGMAWQVLDALAQGLSRESHIWCRRGEVYSASR